MDNSSVKKYHSVTETKAVWLSPKVKMVQDNKCAPSAKNNFDRFEITSYSGERAGPIS